MASVQQLAKRLVSRPEIEIDQAVQVRAFSGTADVQPWLDLRHRAFANQRMGVREWSAGDFQAEFTDRWWWQPERMWLAEANPAVQDRLAIRPPAEPGANLVGSVTLAMRGEPHNARPAVHWLVVHPRWRRRGIGRLLMSQLEAAAWDAGHREVFLETHTAWSAAAEFYAALGYREA